MKRLLVLLASVSAIVCTSATYNMCTDDTLEISYPMVQGEYLLFLSHEDEEIMIRVEDFAYALDNQEHGDVSACKVYHYGRVRLSQGEATSITSKHKPSEFLQILAFNESRILLPDSVSTVPAVLIGPKKEDK